jgi:hypothetical protein
MPFNAEVNNEGSLTFQYIIVHSWKILLLLVFYYNNIICRPSLIQFSPCVSYGYAYTLNQLILQIWPKRRYQLHSLFLYEVYLCSSFCPCLFKIHWLPGPARYIRDVSFHCLIIKYTDPAVGWTSVTTLVRRDVGVFGTKIVCVYRMV